MDKGLIGLVLSSTFGLKASVSLCHKTRPTQSSRSSRSSRLRLGCTRSKSLYPWLGSWVGCQGLFHVPDHLCRTCKELFMPLQMAKQPENTGPRHSSSNDRWHTTVHWLRALLGNGQGSDTAVVHRGRCFSFWYGSHSLLIRVGPSGVLGFRAREVGLGKILRRPCVPIRMGVADSFLYAVAAEIALALESLGIGICRSKAHPWQRPPSKVKSAATLCTRLSEGAALPQMLDHVPRLPAPDRETSFKVWPWHMCMGLARKENHDCVTVCL